MHGISSIFFRAGGTIVPSLYHTAIDLLKTQSEEELAVGTRDEVYNLVRSLALGAIDAGILRERICEMSKGKVSQDQFLGSVLNTKALDRELLRVIDELRETYDLYLISQYPREWLETLLNRFDEKKRFEYTNIIYCAEGGLQNLIPDLFYLVNRLTGKQMENCLLVDGRAEYLSAALRMGLQAVVYVDAFRLRREFVLRSMLRNDRSA